MRPPGLPRNARKARDPRFRGFRVFRGVPVVLVTMLLTGCATVIQGSVHTAGADPSAYDAIEAAIGTPVVADHDHTDPKAHVGSYNLALLASMKGEDGRTPQPTEGYVETAVKNGYGYLCRTGPDEGLVIFDMRDVEHPKQVGYVKVDAGFEPDIEVSDDGHWAFWETQRFPTSAQVPAVDPLANLQRGVHIIDIKDKAHPKVVGFSPTWPDGPHSITYANVGGRHILFQSVYAFAYAYESVEVPQAQRLIVSELDTSLPVPTLKTLAEYREPGATGKPGLFPHDVSVATNPVTGKTYAYVAYWDVGVVILDMTDPAHPTEVGKTTDFGPAPYREVHMVRQFPDLIEGRVVAVVEPEIGNEKDSGYITFLDVTDPAHPSYLSSWLLPGNLTSAGGTLGPHYFDVDHVGRVALASYHAGFWVIDARNVMHPRTTAYALVNATGRALPGPLAALGGSNAFDAWWDQGHLIGGDVHAGLVVYRYDGP